MHMKFLELAKKILTEAQKPMSVTEIWDYAISKDYVKFLETAGKTPMYTLGARLYASARDAKNENFKVVGVRPKRFYIPGVTPKEAIKLANQVASETEELTNVKYLEKDLHCVLTYVARNQLVAYCKTINHQKSKRGEYAEWMHPDVVGCAFPGLDWRAEVNELSHLLGDTQIRLYSFEIKQRLSFSNLRESFFQAVSNSSWAHEGYLVTAEISIEPEFIKELGRLSQAFGIGLILLDLKNPDDSEIVLQADGKEFIDWDTLNKLAELSEEFREFISRIKKDATNKEIREEWFDKLLSTEEIVKKFNKLIR